MMMMMAFVGRISLHSQLDRTMPGIGSMLNGKDLNLSLISRFPFYVRSALKIYREKRFKTVCRVQR